MSIENLAELMNALLMKTILKKRLLTLFFFSGSGAIGLTQIDRYFNDDSITNMIQRIQSLSYHYEGRLQLHLIGGFSDSRRISHALSISLLRK